MTVPFQTPQVDLSVAVRSSFKVLCLLGEGREAQELRRTLRADGFVVDTCGSPEEALGAVTGDLAIGTVLCGNRCGTLRGQDVYSMMLDLVPSQRPLKLILLAEDLSLDEMMDVVRLQAVDVLRRPVEPQMVLEAIRRADMFLNRRAAEMLIVQRATDLAESLTSIKSLLQSGTPWRHAGSDRKAASPGESEGGTAAAQDRLSGDLRRVRIALRAQKAQRTLFGSELVANPCWDMLLDLYEKTLMHRSVSVSSLALASGVPVTTALRRLAKLEELLFVRRAKDHADGRRVFIELTELGHESLERYLELIER